MYTGNSSRKLVNNPTDLNFASVDTFISNFASSISQWSKFPVKATAILTTGSGIDPYTPGGGSFILKDYVWSTGLCNETPTLQGVGSSCSFIITDVPISSTDLDNVPVWKSRVLVVGSTDKQAQHKGMVYATRLLTGWKAIPLGNDGSGNPQTLFVTSSILNPSSDLAGVPRSPTILDRLHSSFSTVDRGGYILINKIQPGVNLSLARQYGLNLAQVACYLNQKKTSDGAGEPAWWMGRGFNLPIPIDQAGAASECIVLPSIGHTENENEKIARLVPFFQKEHPYLTDSSLYVIGSAGFGFLEGQTSICSNPVLIHDAGLNDRNHYNTLGSLGLIDIRKKSQLASLSSSLCSNIYDLPAISHCCFAVTGKNQDSLYNNLTCTPSAFYCLIGHLEINGNQLELHYVERFQSGAGIEPLSVPHILYLAPGYKFSVGELDGIRWMGRHHAGQIYDSLCGFHRSNSQGPEFGVLPDFIVVTGTTFDEGFTFVWDKKLFVIVSKKASGMPQLAFAVSSSTETKGFNYTHVRVPAYVTEVNSIFLFPSCGFDAGRLGALTLRDVIFFIPEANHVVFGSSAVMPLPEGGDAVAEPCPPCIQKPRSTSY